MKNQKPNDAQVINELIANIARYSKDHDIDPHEIKKSDFFKEYTSVSSRKVESLGGFKTLVQTNFKKNLGAQQAVRRNKAYIRKLERKVGDMEAYRDKIAQDIGKMVGNVEVNPHVLNSKATKNYLDKITGKKSKTTRSVVTIWSDHHFGTNVDPQQMGGRNEFNWKIGARRLAFLCEQIASYKIEKRKEHEELVVLLMGDNIGGIIHNQEGRTYDLVTEQVIGASIYYQQALMYLKNFFPKIRVFCQAGNHGRMMHKMSQDRALQDKYDSHEHQIFSALSFAFANDPKIEIITPKTPYCDALIQGHRVYATHGDTTFEVGNVGKTISLEKIEVKANKINAGELGKGKEPYKMFCTGHVHHPVITQVGPGHAIMINGCLVGLDAYAMSGANVHSSTAVQLVWETTPKYVNGDNRKIYTDLADHIERYDKIIRPYDYELTFEEYIKKST